MEHNAWDRLGISKRKRTGGKLEERIRTRYFPAKETGCPKIKQDLRRFKTVGSIFVEVGGAVKRKGTGRLDGSAPKAGQDRRVPSTYKTSPKKAPGDEEGQLVRLKRHLSWAEKKSVGCTTWGGRPAPSSAQKTAQRGRYTTSTLYS